MNRRKTQMGVSTPDLAGTLGWMIAVRVVCYNTFVERKLPSNLLESILYWFLAPGFLLGF